MIGIEVYRAQSRKPLKQYYVYDSPGCETWLEYDTLSDAIAENPREWVWCRDSKLPAYQPDSGYAEKTNNTTRI